MHSLNGINHSIRQKKLPYRRVRVCGELFLSFSILSWGSHLKSPKKNKEMIKSFKIKPELQNKLIDY